MTSSAPPTLGCKTGLTALLVIGSIRLLGILRYPFSLMHPRLGGGFGVDFPESSSCGRTD